MCKGISLFVLLFAGAVAAMPPWVAMQQQKAASGGTTYTFVNAERSYPSSSASITPSGAGHVIVLAVGGNSAATPTISSSAGNTYQLREQNGTLWLYVATNCSASADTVSDSSPMTDEGMTLIEFSGATTFGVSGQAGAANNIVLTTSSTGIFVVVWLNEALDSPSLTGSLSPGSVSASTIFPDHAGHWDQSWYWLNGGAGFAAGTWTLSPVNSDGGGANRYAAVHLK